MYIGMIFPFLPVRIIVSISDEDDLMLDNTGIAVINEDYQIKALLATERNVFLERAVSFVKILNCTRLIRRNSGSN